MACQPLCITLRSRVIVDAVFPVAEAMTFKHCHQRHADCSDVAVTAHLGNEAATGLKYTPDLGEHRILITNPVKGCVRENGIERRGAERKRFSVRLFDLDSPFAGGGDHFGGGVDTQHGRSRYGDAPGELSVSTAQIENVFPGLGG